MKVLQAIALTGVTAFSLMLAASTPLWALVAAPVSGLGIPMSGESRGVTGVGGRVLCARCDLEDVRTSQPDLIGLYELQHRRGQVVMQLARPEDASAAAWWEAIVGLNHVMAVRTPDAVFAQLMDEENLNRRVGIQGLLRPTRTYDVANITFLEGKRPLLGAAPAPDAETRAEEAARRAEAAASQVERSADRLEEASRVAEAEFEAQLRK